MGNDETQVRFRQILARVTNYEADELLGLAANPSALLPAAVRE